MRDYVISVKRIRDYSGNLVEPYWEYASYDRYAGAMSTGYPVFDHLAHAVSFDSIEEAEEAFPNWWKNFVYGHSNYEEDYDLSTLAIRKINFSTKKKLTV